MDSQSHTPSKYKQSKINTSSTINKLSSHSKSTQVAKINIPLTSNREENSDIIFTDNTIHSQITTNTNNFQVNLLSNNEFEYQIKTKLFSDLIKNIHKNHSNPNNINNNSNNNAINVIEIAYFLFYSNIESSIKLLFDMKEGYVISLIKTIMKEINLKPSSIIFQVSLINITDNNCIDYFNSKNNKDIYYLIESKQNIRMINRGIKIPYNNIHSNYYSLIANINEYIISELEDLIEMIEPILTEISSHGSNALIIKLLDLKGNLRSNIIINFISEMNCYKEYKEIKAFYTQRKFENDVFDNKDKKDKAALSLTNLYFNYLNGDKLCYLVFNENKIEEINSLLRDYSDLKNLFIKRKKKFVVKSQVSDDNNNNNNVNFDHTVSTISSRGRNASYNKNHSTGKTIHKSNNVSHISSNLEKDLFTQINSLNKVILSKDKEINALKLSNNSLTKNIEKLSKEIIEVKENQYNDDNISDNNSKISKNNINKRNKKDNQSIINSNNNAVVNCNNEGFAQSKQNIRAVSSMSHLNPSALLNNNNQSLIDNEEKERIRTLHKSLSKLKDKQKLLQDKIYDSENKSNKKVIEKNQEITYYKNLLLEKERDVKKKNDLVVQLEDKISELNTEINGLKNKLKEKTTSSIINNNMLYSSNLSRQSKNVNDGKANPFMSNRNISFSKDNNNINNNNTSMILKENYRSLSNNNKSKNASKNNHDTFGSYTSNNSKRGISNNTNNNNNINSHIVKSPGKLIFEEVRKYFNLVEENFISLIDTEKAQINAYNKNSSRLLTLNIKQDELNNKLNNLTNLLLQLNEEDLSNGDNKKIKITEDKIKETNKELSLCFKNSFSISSDIEDKNTKFENDKKSIKQRISFVLNQLFDSITSICVEYEINSKFFNSINKSINNDVYINDNESASINSIGVGIGGKVKTSININSSNKLTKPPRFNNK